MCSEYRCHLTAAELAADAVLRGPDAGRAAHVRCHPRCHMLEYLPPSVRTQWSWQSDGGKSITKQVSEFQAAAHKLH